MEMGINADILSHVEQKVKSQVSSLEESISRMNDSIEQVQSSIENHTRTLDEKLNGHVSSIAKEMISTIVAVLGDVHARSMANLKDSFETRLDSISKKIEQLSDMDGTFKEALVTDETKEQAADSQKEFGSKIAALEDSLDSRIGSILDGRLDELVQDRISENLEKELRSLLLRLWKKN